MGKRGTMRGKIYILVRVAMTGDVNQADRVAFPTKSIKVLCLFYLLARISASALKLTALRSLAEVLPIKTRHIRGWFLRETKSPIPSKNGFRLILPNTVVFFNVRNHDISI
ncbi:hypothetical protein DBV15_08577 [Temnothorax longispinosus]|uniref:Uncharacterized protein n=1 Tax=Temnothorax longispinosus TaxID=300112 RepID=A0A4S2L4V1_9HYME|nr:hypothetical protein DBV15_08577 [Temnothorax longispinosus]